MTKKTPAPRKSGGLFKKIILILTLCIILLLVFIFGTRIGRETARPVITSELLGQQLRSIQELVSVEYFYTNMGKFENQVNFYGWKVPFTSKSFIVSYDGVIKAGIDFSKVQVDVDEEKHTITVSLPGSKITDNNIPQESINVLEVKDGLFNKVSFDDYNTFISEQKIVMEKKAIDQGILDSADDEAKAVVTAFLSLVPGIENYSLTIN